MSGSTRIIKGLKVADVEVGAATSHLLPGLRVTDSIRTLAFTRAIEQRYQQTCAGISHLERMLIRNRPGLITHRAFHHADLHFAPRISLAVLKTEERPLKGEPDVVRVPELAKSVPRLQMQTRTIIRRVETPPWGEAPTIVHRSAPASDRKPSGAVERRGDEIREAAMSDFPKVSAEKYRSGVFDVSEMNALTDHVIHTIDRRIIAQRERLGKV